MRQEEAIMAGVFSKILKIAAGAAGAAGVYAIGKRNGRDERNAVPQKVTLHDNRAVQVAAMAGAAVPKSGGAATQSDKHMVTQLGVRPHIPTKSEARSQERLAAKAQTRARRNSMNARSNELLSRIVEKACEGGSIAERFDKIMQDSPSAPLIAEVQVDTAEQLEPGAVSGAELQSSGERQALPDEPASPEASEQEQPAEPEPYQIIEEAISSSELFSEENPEAYKPVPFTMGR